MTKDEILFESFGMSIQAMAMAKATKRLLLPPEKQEEFVRQYKACLQEIIRDMQCRHPELSPIIQKLLSQEELDFPLHGQ